MSLNVVVIGARGQLGMDICREFSEKEDRVIPLDIEEIDIAQEDVLSKVLPPLYADWLINTAAMHHVEKCEEQPQQAFQVNALGSRNLARFCQRLGIPFIHISTDYVFDGKKMAPYLESDCPRPLNVYGNSKLCGEYFIAADCARHYILRTSGLYGIYPCRAKGHNFVDLMLKLAKERQEIRVVDDEFLTPTATADLARQIYRIAHGHIPYGLYHATAEGSCSWFEFAKEIFSLTRTKIKLNPAAPGEFPAKVPRPKYSVLENGNLNRHRLNIMSHWQEELKGYLQIKGLIP